GGSAGLVAEGHVVDLDQPAQRAGGFATGGGLRLGLEDRAELLQLRYAQGDLRQAGPDRGDARGGQPERGGEREVGARWDVADFDDGGRDREDRHGRPHSAAELTPRKLTAVSGNG